MADKPIPGSSTSRLPLKRTGIPSVKSKAGAAVSKRRSKSTSDLSRIPAEPSLSARAASFKNLTKLPSHNVPPFSTAGTKKRTAGYVAGEKGHGGKRPLLQVNHPKVQKTQPAVGAIKRPLPSTKAEKSENSKPKPWDIKGLLEVEKEKVKNLKTEMESLQQAVQQSKIAVAHTEQLQTRLDNVDRDLEEALKEIELNKHLSTVNKQLSQKLSEQKAIIASIREEKQQLQDDLRKMEADVTVLTMEKDRLQALISNLESSLSFSQKQCQEKENTIVHLQADIVHYNELRKAMHNKIMDLKGNIRVYCRVRPVLASENGQQLYDINYPDVESIEISSTSVSKPSNTIRSIPKEKKNFNLNRVFSEDSTQEDIFTDVSELIQSALDGFNVCVCAYGITGSGKTFTMDGAENTQRGVIPRAINSIFSGIEKLKEQGWNYSVTISCYQLYNEEIKDLIDVANPGPHEIRKSPLPHKELYITNMTTKTVESATDVHKVLALARKHRCVAATTRNHSSSRSHSITQVELIGVNEQRKETSYGTLYLVDLAGSEKMEDGNAEERRKETTNINLSLTHLRTVIKNLAAGTKIDQIDYRSSKLTYLLKPCLGGNSKTLVLVTLSPLEDHFRESLESLRFAISVSCCKQKALKVVKKI